MKRHADLSPDERDRYIVERLRLAPEPVSGEVLAAEMGLSRVALWKRMDTLKAWGYGVRSSRKGYELSRDDGLAAWELDAPGPVRLFEEVDSTMDEARAWADGGASSGSMVIALRQATGRGRLGSHWDSPTGGLYLSVVLRSALPVSHAGCLVLEAGLAVVGELSAAGVGDASFRWPGDLVAGGDARGTKRGGILVELAGAVDRADYYVVGIGLYAAPALPRRAGLAAGVARRLAAWAAAPDTAPGRWASLLPGKPAVAELWTGETKAFEPVSYTPRGDLEARDGSVVSAGECNRVTYEGAVP